MAPNWRCIWGKVSLSVRLNALSPHDALLYTWGLAQADSWGLMRRADAKALIFPKRSTVGRVQAGIDRLIEARLLCLQEGNGAPYIHWCNWDTYQPETMRWRERGKAAKAWDWQCPNEANGASPDKSGGVRSSPLEIEKEIEIEKETNTPLKPPLEGGAASPRRRRRGESKNPGSVRTMAEIRRRQKEGFGGLGLSPEREAHLNQYTDLRENDGEAPGA